MRDKEHLRPLFFPRGVAGPDNRTGYTMDRSGIDALELLSGQVIWQSEITARPVMATENRLAALRTVPGKTNALQVVVLDREDHGKLLLESESILFPDWVSAGIVSGGSFRYETGTEGDDLLVEWEARANYRGGAHPTRRIELQATEAASGIARVGFKTGKVKMLPAHSKTEVRVPPALQSATVFSYQTGASDTWETEPWVVGDMLALITGEISGEQQVLQLRRWNPKSGRVYEPVRLIAGQALVTYVTQDGCYLLIHSEMPAQGSWWLFSVVAGQQIAVLPYEDGAREACILNSHVYHIVESPAAGVRSVGGILRSTLKAVDSVSGKLIWERSLSSQRTERRPTLRH